MSTKSVIKGSRQVYTIACIPFNSQEPVVYPNEVKYFLHHWWPVDAHARRSWPHDDGDATVSTSCFVGQGPWVSQRCRRGMQLSPAKSGFGPGCSLCLSVPFFIASP